MVINMKRLLATLIFVITHIVYYLVFSQFLSGKSMAIAVYACTVITFVLLDGLLLAKRGVKCDKE